MGIPDPAADHGDGHARPETGVDRLPVDGHPASCGGRANDRDRRSAHARLQAPPRRDHGSTGRRLVVRDRVVTGLVHERELDRPRDADELSALGRSSPRPVDGHAHRAARRPRDRADPQAPGRSCVGRDVGAGHDHVRGSHRDHDHGVGLRRRRRHRLRARDRPIGDRHGQTRAGRRSGRVAAPSRGGACRCESAC